MLGANLALILTRVTRHSRSVIIVDVQAPLREIRYFVYAYSVVKCDQHIINRQNGTVKLMNPGNLQTVGIFEQLNSII